jgi:hypothetical protein
MKRTINLALIMLISSLSSVNVWADDKNFGKTAPSENEI